MEMLHELNVYLTQPKHTSTISKCVMALPQCKNIARKCHHEYTFGKIMHGAMYEQEILNFKLKIDRDTSKSE